MVSLRFTVPSSAAKADAKKPFYHAKIAHYESLLNRDIPGGAWFRHQVRLARAELRLQPNRATAADEPLAGRRRSDDLTRTYDLFTGGRAMSENLQLDRQLPRARPDENPVKIDSLTGITINEIDWKPLSKDARAKARRPGRYIPADQHVVFFPSFAAAMAIADETSRHDTPVLRLAQPRSENARRCRAVSDAARPVDEFARPAVGAAVRPERRADRLRSVLPHGDRRGGALRVAAADDAGEPAVGRIALAAAVAKDGQTRSAARSPG